MSGDNQIIGNFKIYSYSMTVSQAVDLMQRTADGENGQIGKQKTEYSTFSNNCNHQQWEFMRQVKLYEQKMRNRKQFDGYTALNNHIEKNSCFKKQIFELQNLWLGAVVYKSMLGYQYLRIYIALKDYKPFELNYGQIEYLEMKDETMRIQIRSEMEVQLSDYNVQIEKLQQVQNQLKYYENYYHPYSDFLDHLKQIQY